MWSASMVAQASAVEKVSSGRWQLKPPEVEGIRYHEGAEGLDLTFEESLRVVDDIDRDYERERPRSVSSVVGGFMEVKERTLPVSYTDRTWDQERARSPMYPDLKERNAAGFSNEGTRRVSSEGRFDASKLYQQGSVEVPQRPKLKLLPRTKPLDSPDIQTRDFDDKQAPVSLVQIQNVHEMHDSTNPPKPGVLE